MGLFLAVLSLVLSFFSPADIVPAMAPFHLLELIMLPGLIASVALVSMRLTRVSFTFCFLVVMVWVSAAMSLFTKFRFGNAYDTIFLLGPSIAAFFLVHFNSFSLKRIRILAAVLSVSALIMALQGILAFHAGYRANDLLYVRASVLTGSVFRVRGLGFLNDPNDFAQFLLIGLALLGVFWKEGRIIRNWFLLGPAAMVLLYGIYLTFSRGAIFGLLVILAIASYRKGAQIRAFLVGIAGFVTMLAIGFGGGREISLAESSASGRIMAWGEGIAMLKTNPLFGVGYNRFVKVNDLTAHNSFVLCFAELGLCGYFFYMAMHVVAVAGLWKLSRLPVKTSEDKAFASAIRAVSAAFIAFVSTSWFLSRTYTVTLYVLIGLVASLIQMRQQEVPALTLPASRWVGLTITCQALSLLVVYATIRLRSF